MTQAMQRDRSNVNPDDVANVDELLIGFADANNRNKSDRIEALYNYYKPVALRYAKRANATDLEGIVNLALFDSFRALGYMRSVNDHTFRRYLYRAIENQSINEGRKPIPVPVDVCDSDVEPGRGFEADLIATMHIGDMIDELPEDQRAVMTHRIINGRTANETGLILGKKPNAVYQLQHRATRRLQRMLLTAAVVLIVVGAAIAITRQAGQQIIDSSPARPTADEIQGVTTTSPEPESQVPAETVANNNTSEAVGGVQAGSVERLQQPDDAASAPAEPAPDAAPPTSVQTTAPPEAPATTASDAPTTAVDPEAPDPEASDPEASTTSTPASTATSQPAGGHQPVVAVDDVLQLTIGESVDFNVMANDGPRPSLGTVRPISGSIAGLTLGTDGRLTGAPTESRSVVIVYQLLGNNDTSDIGYVRISVE